MRKQIIFNLELFSILVEQEANGESKNKISARNV
jgi:hypothetical protein